MKRIVIMIVTVAFMVGAADAQHMPRRPPWGDVCCGGPCCLKPPHPRH